MIVSFQLSLASRCQVVGEGVSRLKQLIDKGGHLLFAYPNGGRGGHRKFVMPHIFLPTICAAQCCQGIRRRKEGGGLAAGFNNSGSLLSFLVNFSMCWFRELILLSIRPEV